MVTLVAGLLIWYRARREESEDGEFFPYICSVLANRGRRKEKRPRGGRRLLV
jgi:hypothetical protein